MFFDDELDKKYKDFDNFGFFNSDDLDHNQSFYEIMQERIYSRWKYHFILVLSFIYILSLYYPFLFVFIFFDLIRLWCVLRTIDSFLSQDVDFDIDLYESQQYGGDCRLNLYLFLSYDCLGYVLYDKSSVGEFICNEVYEYSNSIGLYNYIIIYDNKKLLYKIKSYKKLLYKIKSYKNKKLLYNNNDILNFKNKYDINISKLDFNKLFFISNTNNLNIKNKNKKCVNYYISLNSDRCFSFFDFINDKKLIKSKINKK